MSDDSPVLDTTAGRVCGRTAGAAMAFLGIPYAAPPTGARRWARPEPAVTWAGARVATAFGPAAPQPERRIGVWSHGPISASDEDCLSLNVWAPADFEGRSRPVLVWIHGGGWALGYSGSPVLDGSRLAAATDSVVVTLNYRLGSLGYLNHPELGANWGLLDQALALAWVRDNIARFGGDPAAVTLSGQSAGAGSALHLLASPLGEGLFHRLIAQSPPMGELTVPASRGRLWTEALSAHLCGGSALDLEAMRGVPFARVVDAHEALLATSPSRGTRGGAMPVVDPATLPADPRTLPGVRLEVPVLIGTAADEATFLFRAAGRRLDPDAAALRAIVAHLPDVGGEDAAAELIASARAGKAGETGSAGTGSAEGADNLTVLCRLATQQLFAGPVAEWAQARVRAGGEVLRYRVEHRSPDPALGATHTIDVPLLFGTYGGEIGARVTGDGPRSQGASRAMMSAWREFLHGRTPWDSDHVEVF